MKSNIEMKIYCPFCNEAIYLGEEHVCETKPEHYDYIDNIIDEMPTLKRDGNKVYYKPHGFKKLKQYEDQVVLWQRKTIN